MTDNETKYTKLSALVDDSFTVNKAYGYSWKLWDDATKRFILSDTYQEGFRKIYTVDTDKGKMDLGSGQLSNLLEAVYKNGQADINGRTFHVKSNGKTGLDIRYYFSVKNTPAPQPAQAPVDNLPTEFEGAEPVNLDNMDIPF